MSVPSEASLVFNIVWTGTVFDHMWLFTESLLAQSECRYRFVANGCPPAQIAAMEAMAARHGGRIVEVIDVSPDDMIAHGVALERVRAIRDDGDHFCLIDPDIKANAPFVDELAGSLADHDAVTSGTEVWSDDNLIPVGHIGVAGEHFFDREGFVFGSPHLAMYRREALDAVAERYGVGLGSAGPELGDEARAALVGLGHLYVVYDTGKIVNALIQAAGGSVVHRDLPQLVHIGGLSHYLSPPGYRVDDDGQTLPDWTVHESMGDRHEVTRFVARALSALADGSDPPEPPQDLAPPMEKRLHLVRDEIVDLVARYGHR